jgi:ribosomal subunit interface protein
MATINKKINFRHMDSDPGIEAYINKHLEKIEHFLQNERTPIDIDFTIIPSKTREHHKVELRIYAPPHYDLIAEIEKNGTDFYDAVNIVIDSMIKQLHKSKAQRVDDRNHGKQPIDRERQKKANFDQGDGEYHHEGDVDEETE